MFGNLFVGALESVGRTHHYDVEQAQRYVVSDIKMRRVVIRLL